jgi:hypothetical protein
MARPPPVLGAGTEAAVGGWAVAAPPGAAGITLDETLGEAPEAAGDGVEDENPPFKILPITVPEAGGFTEAVLVVPESAGVVDSKCERNLRALGKDSSILKETVRKPILGLFFINCVNSAKHPAYVP